MLLLRTLLSSVPLALAAAMAGTAVSAQEELPLKHDLGEESTPDCRTPQDRPDPGAEARMQATELASIADQALILGDLERARAVLDRAIDLDPGSGELAYRRGRVLQDLGEHGLAVTEYCRALAASEGADAFGDARERMESLVKRRDEVPANARADAIRGVASAESGDLEQALNALDAATREAPGWAEAAYNRGVVLARLGRNDEAALELRRYLDLTPAAPDAVEVSRRIGQLEVLVVALSDTPSPLAALTLGTLLPGMGQFYSGRARGGFLVVGLTAGAVAGGLLITEVNIRCQDPVEPGERCPDDAVVSRRNDRPHFTQSLGLAAAVAVLGATEAFIHARARRNGRDPYGPRLVGPSIVSSGDRVDLNVLSVRFR